MRSLIFDTETTGLWDFKKPYDHPAQPEMVQVAAKLICDSTFRVLGQINYIVQPDKPCEEKAASIHGITSELIQEAGVPRRVALGSFHNLLKLSTRVVAHNFNFDSKILMRTYLLESTGYDLFTSKPSFCTMLETTPLLKLPGRYGKYKWPSLMEAYTSLVDPAGFDGAHDAMVDVNACAAVYRALQEMKNGDSTRVSA